MVEPQVQPLIGFPLRGRRDQRHRRRRLSCACRSMNEADFEKYRGKLAGKIVLTQPARAVPLLEGNVVHAHGRRRLRGSGDRPCRRAPAQRAVSDGAPQPAGSPGLRRGWRSSTRTKASSRSSIAAATATWRPAAATCRGSSSIPTAGRSFRPAPAPRATTPATACRQVTLAVEHYNRMVRVLDEEHPGEGGAQRRDEVLRRDHAERLQHRRRDAGHRSSARGRSRDARRALRLASRPRPARPTTPPDRPR